MSIDWNKLRSWNGSQASAFEELCCQLAAVESVPDGSRFFRKGTPDAGVECFWQLPNGDEWAWQGKFFRTAPGPAQWTQIDKSVTKAIGKHPRLTKYTVALPVDRSDAGIDGKKSFFETWNERVTKWQGLADDRGMSVEFEEYWGQSDIGGRLSDEKHRGRHWFWFSEERFSNAWFIDHVEEAVANARDRYRPDLNVELPIRRVFDALGRTPLFLDHLVDLYSRAHIQFKKLNRRGTLQPLEVKLDHVFKIAKELFAQFEPWVRTQKDYAEWHLTASIPWHDIEKLAGQLSSGLTDIVGNIDELKRRRKKENCRESYPSSDDLAWLAYDLKELRWAISSILNEGQSRERELSNDAVLLLVGKAGQGKTHLLCDVAKWETYASRPRLLFHGEHFQDAEPWSQMIRLLGLNCSPDEFIGALEAAAQANKCRILIFIDALNEGDGNRLWRKYLSGMLTTLARSPWLGLCVSVRTDYEELVIPESLREPEIIRIVHTGFAENAIEAATKFFSHFGIQPTGPILSPQFNNPLFLKLLCEGFSNDGHKRVPSGLRGITNIFRFHIDSIHKKLSHPELLNYDPRSRIVHDAVESLANEMANRKADRLPLDQAREIVNACLPRVGHDNSLFHHLESEGVLTVVPEDRRWAGGDWSESVRFTYQMFSDHMITQRLLESHLDRAALEESFSKDPILGRLVKDQAACMANRGILAAMAIQIPERTGRELPELAPHLACLPEMAEAFVQTLVWRNMSSFSPATDRYVNEKVLPYEYTTHDFWDALVTLAATPHHPYNADHLHQMLMGIAMPERDATWSIWLHRQWGNQQAVERLVDWAWEENDKSVFEDEVIRLAGIALAWFFTSSNRFLRDRATKAMVRLCEQRIGVLRQVISTFTHVNDPYVAERLCAVAYGCAMRTTDNESLAELAQDMYCWIFESGTRPPHILLRDYARGVIETAMHRGATLDIDISKVRPPYRSTWPAMKIPDPEELESWGESKPDMPDAMRARVGLYRSVMGGAVSDFSDYVVGRLDEWSSERLDEPHTPTHKEMHDQFVDSLTERQRKAWDRYGNVRWGVDFYRSSTPERRQEVFKRQYTEAELDDELNVAASRFVRTLGKNSKKSKLFHEIVLPYVVDPNEYFQENCFDPGLAKRWMMQKIIDMGWTVERFGEFDRDVNRYRRQDHNTGHKPERIGKKYQWIAYHELLARLSDNFKMREDELSSRSARYHGPWDPISRRDIDPSNLLRKTEREGWQQHTYTWWFPTRFDSWEEPAREVEWLKTDCDLPPADQLIEVVCSRDASRWFSLGGSYDWEQPTPPGEDRFETKRRKLWYLLKCYLIKTADSSKLMNWAIEQNWFGRWMPKSKESDEIFLGEFFWAPAFKDQDWRYFGRPGWTRGDGERIPAEILVANDEYGAESNGYDCSLDDSISIHLPCRLLVEGMNLDWRAVEGKWYDSAGQLVAFDPAVRSPGPSVLLVRREPLLDFLHQRGLTLCWTVLGEKQTIGGPMTHDDYKGLLRINGAYALEDDVLSGTTWSRWVPADGLQE